MGFYPWWDCSVETICKFPFLPYILHLAHPQQLWCWFIFFYAGFLNDGHWATAIFVGCNILIAAVVNGYSQHRKAFSLECMGSCSRHVASGKLPFTVQYGRFNLLTYSTSVILMLIFGLFQLFKIENPSCNKDDNAPKPEGCLGSLGVQRNSFGFIFVTFSLPILSYAVVNSALSRAREQLAGKYSFFARQNDAIMGLASMQYLYILGGKESAPVIVNCHRCKDVLREIILIHDDKIIDLNALHRQITRQQKQGFAVGIFVPHNSRHFFKSSLELLRLKPDLRIFEGPVYDQIEYEDKSLSEILDGVEAQCRGIGLRSKYQDPGFHSPDSDALSQSRSLLDVLEEREEDGSKKKSNKNLYLSSEGELPPDSVPYIMMEKAKWASEPHLANAIIASRSAAWFVFSYASFRLMTIVAVTFFFVCVIVFVPSPRAYAPESVKSLINSDSSTANTLTGALQFFELDPTGIAIMLVMNTLIASFGLFRTPLARDMTTFRRHRNRFNFKWYNLLFLIDFSYGLILASWAVVVYILTVFWFGIRGPPADSFGSSLGFGAPYTTEAEYTAAIGSVSIAMYVTLTTLCFGAYMMSYSEGFYILDMFKLITARNNVFRDLIPLTCFVGCVAVAALMGWWWPFPGGVGYFNNPSTPLELKTSFFYVGLALGFSLVSEICRKSVAKMMTREKIPNTKKGDDNL